MHAQPPKAHTKLAAAILVAALIIAAAVLASSHFGTRAIITTTRTIITTGLTTTAISASQPNSSTTRITTSTLFSSVGNGSALVLDSADGLGLGLQFALGSDGSYTITVEESNLLNSVNNVTLYDDWAFQKSSLNPANPCGPSTPIPVGFAILQGNYGQDNYTAGQALTLYDPNDVYLCGSLGFVNSSEIYSFQPLSDDFLFPLGSGSSYHGPAAVTFTTNGYWVGGQQNGAAAFQPFSPGVYTIVGADEWGEYAILHFEVTG